MNRQLCGECRLLQEAAPRCIACGHQPLQSFAIDEPRRRWWPRFRRRRSLLTWRQYLIGGLTVVAMAYSDTFSGWWFLLAGGVAAGAAELTWVDPARRLPAATAPFLLPRAGEVRRGRVHARGPLVRSHVDGSECLAAVLYARSRGDEGLYLWSLRRAELEVAADDGSRILLGGAVMLSGPSRPAPAGKLPEILRIPSWLKLEKASWSEIVLGEGDAVELYGPVRNSGGAYREGKVEEMRGLAGDPITLTLA